MDKHKDDKGDMKVDLIKGSGDKKGLSVPLSELRRINGFNQKAINDIKGDDNASFLLDDGHMSLSEAQSIEKTVKGRHFGTGEVENNVEHWFAREVLNKTKDFVNDKEISNFMALPSQRNNVEAGKQVNIERYGDKFTLLKNWQSTLHGPSNFKWVSEASGREIVISNKKAAETRPEYRGTYNYGPKAISTSHVLLDVKPWVGDGNSPDDSTGSWQRMKMMAK